MAEQRQQRSLFRPCIDLHGGCVKQIVGGTLTDKAEDNPQTNFVASQTPDYFAKLYHDAQLRGGHVIMLGPGNTDAARAALAVWPGGLQVGGGINLDNAQSWLDAGADKVIVTSWLFDDDGRFQEDRAKQLCEALGKDRVVIDLSCRRRRDGWFVAIKKWQVVTDLEISAQTLEHLAQFCSEFLVHAADVEGLCQGIDEDLVVALSRWSPIPCTYAGGARSLADLKRVDELSCGKVDLTIGSALDIFGGKGVTLDECVQWNQDR